LGFDEPQVDADWGFSDRGERAGAGKGPRVFLPSVRAVPGLHAMTTSETRKRQPATVVMIAEVAATGRVREIYDDIKATKQIDFVPNFWKTLATSPPLLDQIWTRLKTTMAPGRLDSLTKEMIALAVSATNGCAYCVNSHTAAVRKLGLDDAGLGELMAVVAMFNATNSLAEGYQIEPDVLP
jgi:AhpD family alkylhydroperoxidase